MRREPKKLKKLQKKDSKIQNHTKQLIDQDKQNVQNNIVNTDPPIKELDRHYKAAKSKLLGGKKIRKRVTKKTIKQKYTVGKSKMKKQVSVLVKGFKNRKRFMMPKKN